ncbi:transglycosylase domain-containing protein [Luteococcus sanguinis]|uniref:Transglycosylase domain-containing protein n=1 Tax=Luteococcus sanguinis TaxID=174038 RepID=A0ABW1WZ26_9ACTN
MTEPASGRKAYNLLMFGLASVLAGIVVAGLVVPPALLAGAAVKSGADSMENLPASMEIGAQSERSRVLMADGSTLVEFYEENRVYVPLSKISKLMQQAQVDIEDDRFYEHGAIDPKGTLRALVRNASGGTQGGSTLTQQYVKQVQVEAAVVAGDEEAAAKAVEPTLSRKVRELRYAIAVEKKFTKDQILERYLNIAYYGDGAYGVEAAARHYFGTTAEKLNLPQSAMLAGLVQNPVMTDPVNHPQTALNRRAIVLNRMAQLGTITEAQAEAAKNVPFDKTKVVASRKGCITSRFPSLCNYVQNVLIRGDFPALGKTAEARENALKRGGLTIQTLINPDSQKAAEKAVAGLIAPTDPFISTMTMIQPKTGLIVAMAQNRPKIGTGKGETYYNYAAEAKYGGAEGYQAGSTFKAFTMAAAFENGLTPDQTFNAPMNMDFSGLSFRSCKGNFAATDFNVKNSVQGYAGNMNMYTAAQGSVNTYFVQLEKKAGLCDTVKMAQKLGIQRADGLDMIQDTPFYDWIPSFTLGPVEIAPMSMAEAYATFANKGVHCDPITIESITTKAGKALAVPSANCKRVISEDVADTVNKVLKSVVDKGTGRAANLYNGHSIAGKTGTTDSAEAVWFAGYTPELVGVSMIAADKQSATYKGRSKRSLTGRTAHGTNCSYGCTLNGSGGGDAGTIWKSAMRTALVDLPKTDFSEPSQDALLGKSMAIPDVSNLSLTEARDTLESAGFSVQDVYVHNSSSYGTFLYMTPTSGTRRTSEPIYFYWSSGPEPKASPTATSTRTSSSTRTSTSKASATSSKAAASSSKASKSSSKATTKKS